ncbi:protein-methionine-sulfoxide reductase heme-binding subunit MsrQ [Rhizobium alvei]|uniref:Protein-methionine-sulfoxide reductase heme-binding subunit MsrQ n=1 Tax=Rhizobium alvei TaxID=1132659 RepID=A0ABT8YNV3_9HYPH|nr:protein-methionine-sulfoxide reductase heme-binding subunit MsrQ [Rhizobium alvei]MDO6965398.1 protein-methionine-sulfoxide reductase heme-binding subunit MsrQ [Rhizobium alvei]
MATANVQPVDLPRRINRALAKVSPWVIYGVGLIPAAWYFYLGATNALGANPVQSFEHLLGEWAIRFLILTLIVTPLRELTRVNLVRFRRALGLLAFYYALMHLATYVLLDRGLDLGVIATDLMKRPYIIIGMTGFVGLLALAVTSNAASIRKMGRNWTRLHWVIYPIALLGITHYLMAVKSWPPRPLLYLAIISVLLGYRLFRRMLPNIIQRRAAA